MNYLQSYLLDRINQIRKYMDLQRIAQEKCHSKRQWWEIENDIRYHRALLNEICAIYQLYLEER